MEHSSIVAAVLPEAHRPRSLNTAPISLHDYHSFNTSSQVSKFLSQSFSVMPGEISWHVPIVDKNRITDPTDDLNVVFLQRMTETETQ